MKEKKKEIIKKIKYDKIKIKSVQPFIKSLIQDEERKRILEEMEKIFRNLIVKYEINHIEENENKKTFSENIDENEKNVINAIYISKNIDEEYLSFKYYAVNLYDEKEVEKIEKGENENINEDFKKYFNDDIEPTDEEINKKYNKILEEIFYIDCCADFLDYFKSEMNYLKLEEKKYDIIKKIKENAKKNIVLIFIKKLIQDEEKKKILEKMEKIFLNLIKEYEINHIKENENKKTFSEKIEENEKNVINAIYISKIIGEKNLSVHDYVVNLYDEEKVEKIEKGENENINEVFKKYNDIEPTDEEINQKYIEICEKFGIEPEKN